MTDQKYSEAEITNMFLASKTMEKTQAILGIISTFFEMITEEKAKRLTEPELDQYRVLSYTVEDFLQEVDTILREQLKNYRRENV